jgi:hypothetical protein
MTKISGSHGGEYEDVLLCRVVLTCQITWLCTDDISVDYASSHFLSLSSEDYV